MKVSKNQLKRIIREEKMALQEQSNTAANVYQGTLYTYALELCYSKYDELIDTVAGESDVIAQMVYDEHQDVLIDVLCDHWVENTNTFSDYPGDEDAMWEALRDAAGIIITEAWIEFSNDIEGGRSNG